MQRVAIISAGVLSWLLLAAEAPGASVYYQVTLANGKLRHESQVPTTNKGIDDVVRVTRYEAHGPSSEIISTGRQPFVTVNPARTVMHKLTWNGKAWVTPRAGGPRRLVRVRTDPVAEEITKHRKLVAVLKKRLGGLDHAVAEAQRKQERVKGTPDEAAAEAARKEAQRKRQAVLVALGQYRQVLDALEGTRGGEDNVVGQASGQVRPTGAGMDKAGGGMVGEPLTDTRVPAHRVQVWKVTPGKGRRQYTVWMAHPEAGEMGAFYYVAYADTDNDARPDKLIARSPLAVADRPGGWTQWVFWTDEEAVYVGNAWTRPHTQVYLKRRKRDRDGDIWRGMNVNVHVSPFWQGGGFHRYGGGAGGQGPDRGPRADGEGFMTNLRYRVDGPGGHSGPRPGRRRASAGS